MGVLSPAEAHHLLRHSPSALYEVDMLFGLPEVLITDQGSNFDSEVFREVCAFLGIDKRRTTAYNPKANGLVERMHSTMKSIIALRRLGSGSADRAVRD